MPKPTPEEHLEHLEKRNFMLQCYENAGVDNWDGCEYAYDEYFLKYPEDE